MDIRERLAAVLAGINIEEDVTGVDPFSLGDLDIASDLDLSLPTNLRLGHLVERVVGALIDASSNYEIVHQSVQVLAHKVTLGELDFIIREVDASRLIHLELGYKFYLYDPTLDTMPINNWIGPNRRDSLIEKLEKLRDRQFPLLYHDVVLHQLPDIDIDVVDQRLCLLASLYMPYGYTPAIPLPNDEAIKGYYINLGQLKGMHTTNKTYSMVRKQWWGLSPEDNRLWSGLDDVLTDIIDALHQRRSVLCWQRDGDVYTQFFVVWW
jgi:hypothetical protein